MLKIIVILLIYMMFIQHNKHNTLLFTTLFCLSVLDTTLCDKVRQ
jgi:hypothetical protein